MLLTKFVSGTPSYSGRSVHIGAPYVNILGDCERGERVKVTMDTDKPNTIILEFKNGQGGYGDGASELLESK